MKKGVIFDFDGLLVDTEIISYQIYRILSQDDHFSIETYAQEYSGKSALTNLKHLRACYPLDWDEEEGMLKVDQIEKELFDKGVALKPGVLELLAYLKAHDIQTAIASSSSRERAMKVLEQHHLENCFDAYVFAEDIIHGKPHPEVFLKAVEKLHLTPDLCLVLEDSVAGIEAASGGGIDVICIPDMNVPDDLHQQTCLAVVSDLTKVIDYLD